MAGTRRSKRTHESVSTESLRDGKKEKKEEVRGGKEQQEDGEREERRERGERERAVEVEDVVEEILLEGNEGTQECVIVTENEAAKQLIEVKRERGGGGERKRGKTYIKHAQLEKGVLLQLVQLVQDVLINETYPKAGTRDPREYLGQGEHQKWIYSKIRQNTALTESMGGVLSLEEFKDWLNGFVEKDDQDIREVFTTSGKGTDAETHLWDSMVQVAHTLRAGTTFRAERRQAKDLKTKNRESMKLASDSLLRTGRKRDFKLVKEEGVVSMKPTSKEDKNSSGSSQRSQRSQRRKSLVEEAITACGDEHAVILKGHKSILEGQMKVQRDMMSTMDSLKETLSSIPSQIAAEMKGVLGSLVQTLGKP